MASRTVRELAYCSWPVTVSSRGRSAARFDFIDRTSIGDCGAAAFISTSNSARCVEVCTVMGMAEIPRIPQEWGQMLREYCGDGWRWVGGWVGESVGSGLVGGWAGVGGSVGGLGWVSECVGGPGWVWAGVGVGEWVGQNNAIRFCRKIYLKIVRKSFVNPPP